MSNDLALVNQLSVNPDFSKQLNGVKEFTAEIWRNTYLPWFTNHNHVHSLFLFHSRLHTISMSSRDPSASLNIFDNS